jgi:hypothetical protein
VGTKQLFFVTGVHSTSDYIVIMKSAGKLMLCLTVVALVSAIAHADDLAVADNANPYTAISERNIFALVPIPTNPPVSDTPPADPPPKISVNGTMTLFDKLEVLFKVATKPPPGQPAQDASYVLGVGDRQDDIEVTKIDDKAKPPVITFINHGVEQVIPLDDTAKLTTPTQGPIISGGGGGPGPGMMNRGGMGGGIPLPGIGLRGRGAPGAGPGPAPSSPYSSGPSTESSAVSSVGSSVAPTAGANNDPTQSSSQMTAEERIVAMEQQRAKWLDEGNPAAAIIPPTPLGEKLVNGEQPPATPP